MTGDPARTRADRTGRRAVPFILEDTEGRTHRLDDFAGRWLLLVFHRHLA